MKRYYLMFLVVVMLVVGYGIVPYAAYATSTDDSISAVAVNADNAQTTVHWNSKDDITSENAQHLINDGRLDFLSANLTVIPDGEKLASEDERHYKIRKYWQENGKYYVQLEDNDFIFSTEEKPDVTFFYSMKFQQIKVQQSGNNWDADVAYQGVKSFSAQQGENVLYFQLTFPKTKQIAVGVEHNSAIDNYRIEEVENLSTESENIIRYRLTLTMNSHVEGATAIYLTTSLNANPPQVSFANSEEPFRPLRIGATGPADGFSRDPGKAYTILTEPHKIAEGTYQFKFRMEAATPYYRIVVKPEFFTSELGSLLINGEPVAIPFNQNPLKLANYNSLQNSLYKSSRTFYNYADKSGPLADNINEFLASSQSSRTTYFSEGINAGVTAEVKITDVLPIPAMRSGRPPQFDQMIGWGLMTFNEYTVTLKNVTHPISISGSVTPTAQVTNYIHVPEVLRKSFLGYLNTEEEPNWYGFNTQGYHISGYNDSGALFSKYMPEMNGKRWIKTLFVIPNGYTVPKVTVIDDNNNVSYPTIEGYKSADPTLWRTTTEAGLFRFISPKNGDKSDLPAMYTDKNSNADSPVYENGYFLNTPVDEISSAGQSSVWQCPRINGWCQGNKYRNNTVTIAYGTTNNISIKTSPRPYSVTLAMPSSETIEHLDDLREVTKTVFTPLPVPQDFMLDSMFTTDISRNEYNEIDDDTYDVKYRSVIRIPNETPRFEGYAFKHWQLTIHAKDSDYDKTVTYAPSSDIDIRSIRLNGNWGADVTARDVTGFTLTPVFEQQPQYSSDGYRIEHNIYDPDAPDHVGPRIEGVADINFDGIPGWDWHATDRSALVPEKLQVGDKSLHYIGDVNWEQTLPFSADAPVAHLLYRSSDITVTFISSEHAQVVGDPVKVVIPANTTLPDGSIPPVNVHSMYMNKGWKIVDSGEFISHKDLLTHVFTHDTTLTPVTEEITDLGVLPFTGSNAMIMFQAFGIMLVLSAFWLVYRQSNVQRL